MVSDDGHPLDCEQSFSELKWNSVTSIDISRVLMLSKCELSTFYSVIFLKEPLLDYDHTWRIVTFLSLLVGIDFECSLIETTQNVERRNTTLLSPVFRWFFFKLMINRDPPLAAE